MVIDRMRIFIRDVMSNPRWEQSCIMSAGRERDPKVYNPPLVGWIQTPIQIRFRGGQTQVRWIQGRVDSENIARYSHTWKRWIATTNCKIIDIANNFIGAILVKLCAMEA